jgi:long-chain acyl-CoA synthetase
MATINRVFDLITNYLEKYPNQKVAFGYKRDGEWKTMSIQEYAQKIDYISYAFLKLGIEPGDKISIISTNRPEWNILDMAAQQIGAIVVPIYPTISQADYKYILNHAEVRLLFIEGKELRTRIQGILPEVKNIEHIYTFMDQGVYPYFQQLEDLGKENPNPEELQRRKDAVKPEDCATINYTSGTTGLPKGVMLSHHNFVKQVEGVSGIPGPKVKRALSFLPLCHAYERMLV